MFVGISEKPISKKICLNSDRTFSNGWSAPAGNFGAASKLNFLKAVVFHLSFFSKSVFKSDSGMIGSCDCVIV